MDSKSIYEQIKLFKLQSDDLAQCMELDQIALNRIWTMDQWKKELINPERLCIGCMKANQLIGLACAHNALEEIYITLLVIHPKYQRLGIGKKMLKTLLKQAKKIGAKIVTLEVKEKNHAANSLYKSLNFKEVGFRAKLYKDGSNAIIYQRDTDT